VFCSKIKVCGIKILNTSLVASGKIIESDDKIRARWQDVIDGPGVKLKIKSRISYRAGKLASESASSNIGI
jgi:hypothetical protein